jgi:hypothetical protein
LSVEGEAEHIQLGQFQSANKRCSLIGHCLGRVSVSSLELAAGIVEKDDRTIPSENRSAVADQHCLFPCLKF